VASTEASNKIPKLPGYDCKNVTGKNFIGKTDQCSHEDSYTVR